MKIDLFKTTETVSWSDEPGAKEYTLDFSDKEVERMQKAVLGMREKAKKLDDTDFKGAAELLEELIVAIGGQELYDDALAYVDSKGEGAAACNIAMQKLADYLVERLGEHLDFDRKKRLAGYLDDTTVI